MELSDFVKTAILSIVSGVENSQSELGARAHIGSSQHSIVKTGLPANMFQDYDARMYCVVDFDIAVTTTDTAKGGGGINVFALKAGGTVEGVAETASRIRFAVPVRFP